jgi:putative DNA primase/helicase
MGDNAVFDEPTNDRRRPAESEAASEAFGGADVDINIDEFLEPMSVEESIAPGIQHLSDADNLRSHARIAHLVAAHSIDQLMHVAGAGWYVWIGTHWERDIDDKRARAAVMGQIRALSVDALTDRNLLADLRQAQSASGIRGVLELMGALAGIRATVDELDADPYLLNVANGTLDLRDLATDDPATVVDLGRLQLHRHNPVNKITRITKARFNPGASSDLWAKFLETSLPDESVRDYLKRTLGLGLIGEQIKHTLPICTGLGRNGKGVLYQAGHNALGSYSHIAPSSLFELTKGDPNKPNPAMLDLRGVRIAWLSETDKGARFDPALMKRLTGGDAITGRYLYQSHAITFSPSHMAILITNHPPQLPADDPALWARTRVCKFDVVIPEDQQDPHLLRKLKSQASADAVLSWMLQGLAEYEASGIGEPQAVKAATGEYMGNQDTVVRFIEAMCTDAPASSGSGTTELHNAYREWSIAEGIMREHRLGLRDFGVRLDELEYPNVKGSGGRRYREGLALDDRPSAIVVDMRAAAPSETTESSSVEHESTLEETRLEGVETLASARSGSRPGLDSWALPGDGSNVYVG